MFSTRKAKTTTAGVLLALLGAVTLALLPAVWAQLVPPAESPIEEPSASLPEQMQPSGTERDTVLPVTRYQLAYIDDAGDLWLASADGHDKHKLLGAEGCPNAGRLVWSPQGDRLACLSMGRRPFTSGFSTLFDFTVLDGTGRVILQAKNAAALAWSPTGSHLAYTLFTDSSEWLSSERHVRIPDDQLTAEHIISDAQGRELYRVRGSAAYGGLPRDGQEGTLKWSPGGKLLAFNQSLGRAAAAYPRRAGQRRRVQHRHGLWADYRGVYLEVRETLSRGDAPGARLRPRA